jgi:hypothetical protein
MAVQRNSSEGASLIDVLDRILDKGVVIDAWVRVSLAGVELITIEGRVVIASIETYLERAEQLGPTTLAAAPSMARHSGAHEKEPSPLAAHIQRAGRMAS